MPADALDDDADVALHRRPAPHPLRLVVDELAPYYVPLRPHGPGFGRVGPGLAVRVAGRVRARVLRAPEPLVEERDPS